MTTGGWINMILAIGSVTLVHAWCLWRVLSRSRPDHEFGRVAPIDEEEADSP